MKMLPVEGGYINPDAIESVIGDERIGSVIKTRSGDAYVSDDPPSIIASRLENDPDPALIPANSGFFYLKVEKESQDAFRVTREAIIAWRFTDEDGPEAITLESGLQDNSYCDGGILRPDGLITYPADEETLGMEEWIRRASARVGERVL